MSDNIHSFCPTRYVLQTSPVSTSRRKPSPRSTPLPIPANRVRYVYSKVDRAVSDNLFYSATLLLTGCCRSLADPTITTIIVGPEKTTLSIHTALVCEHSEYFRGAYHAELQEAHQHRFTFGDIDSKIFRTLIRWMYTNEIYLDDDTEVPLELEFCDDESEDQVRDDVRGESEYGENSEPEEEYEEPNGEQCTSPPETMDQLPDFATMTLEQCVLYRVFGQCYEDSTQLDEYQLEVLLKLVDEGTTYDSFRPRWESLLRQLRTIELEILTLLFDLFILADRFGVKALRARVMDHLQAKRSWRWDGLGNAIPFEMVTKAFDNLPEQSTLCRWLVYIFARDWDYGAEDAGQRAGKDTLPKQFLLGLLALQASGQHGDELDRCYFHEHDTWDELKACRITRGKELSMDAMEEDYPMFDANGETTWF